MKVSRVETLLIAPRFALCRVETDDGLVGWGEPVLEGRAEVVLAAVEAAAELLIGQDPTQVVRHWQTLTKGSYYRNGPILASAVSGLDQALWDIFGKAVGLPVHALLGGAQRDRTRVYAWLHGADTAALVDHARLRLEQGYDAVKLAPARALAP
ncbi:hypothetical protein GCM10025864_14320 [Luteimicrobium album]|uniref:Mandelate racemase/muconate lactonizing enzyme N-terminal domain-containing protein n=1 Tax=Luteimicrobium album TaxID=1054550 RepID=A0ABQ6I0J1_9MICO|nr:hypothetical protein [Luteimicrobium album]GMA23673.1 hypothetical protein GCM10025864_14320 [Luteimicrobium album]